MENNDNGPALKIGMISLGCAKNQVDSELMLGKLNERGFETVVDAAEADVIIVNTCAFIEPAREEAINTILEMAEYKKENCKALIVAGCLAQRYAGDIRAELPEVDAVVGINSVAEIADVVERVLRRRDAEPVAELSEKYSAEYMNGPRVLSTPEGSAYLKIAEGCDNRCSFCAIPLIRGRMRSRRIEDIVTEAEKLAAEGVRELNVIAQDTTKYGRDIYGRPMLKELLEALENVDGVELIRLLYMYPDEISDELIETMARSVKIAHYIDLPLQHISDRLLKKMNRRGSSGQIREVIAKLKAAMPDAILRSSFIVGFPGETEADFEELMAFVDEFRFDRVGVFQYSPEEGTRAASMQDQIPDDVKQERYDRLYTLAQRISLERGRKRVGTVVPVITEDVSEDGIFYIGRSYAEAPDSDGKIYFTSEEPLAQGDIAKVEILIAEEYDLTGRAVGELA
ncbi:MAG: 30S ribosomal protein S12 methylthiotransferase RimO [Clostridia bacterium]|nr:30S ribosomal protein S12 methylthiotransferase RimO [Clostridia bacterium]